jgi:deoxyribonucleoside regulator
MRDEVEDRDRLMANVAYMYYEENLSQEGISKKYKYSRSTISRLIKEARNRGIVEIRVNYPVLRSLDLESRLKQLFGLKAAFVLSIGGCNYPQTQLMIGRTAAAFLDRELADESVLAVSWGTTIYNVSIALAPRFCPRIKVVQMTGSTNHDDPAIDGARIAQAIAQTLGARAYPLYAPYVVKDASTGIALMKEKEIRDVIDLVGQSDLALVGIGSVDPSISTWVTAGYLRPDEVSDISKCGAVGFICSRHYDIRGKILDLELDRRVIGIDLESLASGRDRVVIGVAGGPKKAPAILGGLRGGFLDVLVTDNTTAEMVLSLDGM